MSKLRSQPCTRWGVVETLCRDGGLTLTSAMILTLKHAQLIAFESAEHTSNYRVAQTLLTTENYNADQR